MQKMVWVVSGLVLADCCDDGAGSSRGTDDADKSGCSHVSATLSLSWAWALEPFGVLMR